MILRVVFLGINLLNLGVDLLLVEMVVVRVALVLLDMVVRVSSRA